MVDSLELVVSEPVSESVSESVSQPVSNLYRFSCNIQHTGIYIFDIRYENVYLYF